MHAGVTPTEAQSHRNTSSIAKGWREAYIAKDNAADAALTLLARPACRRQLRSIRCATREPHHHRHVNPVTVAPDRHGMHTQAYVWNTARPVQAFPVCCFCRACKSAGIARRYAVVQARPVTAGWARHGHPVTGLVACRPRSLTVSCKCCICCNLIMSVPCYVLPCTPLHTPTGQRRNTATWHAQWGSAVRRSCTKLPCPAARQHAGYSLR
ncbi:hypothetical protein COO60DRAFT_520050 [Scenedesmus sp. NREL 46B-D3]|nr:hypothetical protein COO60DRAFT_520050 [Scenedesmus sp. NREL 46B-D3]